MSDTSPPQAGWYADPENPRGERWWNGSGWSDHKRDATVGGEVTATATPVYSDPPPPSESPAFSFGSPAAADAARPDPYAPPAVTYGAPQPYYGQPASPYAPPPYGAPAPGQGVNGLALAGLIVGAVGWLILPLIAGIAGIVLSGFGLAHARRREAAGNPNSGRGLAIAGLVVSGVVTAFSVLIVVAYVGILMSYTTNTF